MKITVVYHSADFDGIFCREIAKKFLPPDTEFIGWNFGDAPLPVPTGMFYVLDLPVDRVFGLKFSNGEAVDELLELFDRLIWIDHHKTAIETHPKDIPGYRIDGVAACRLAWQWFLKRVSSTIPVTAEDLNQIQNVINTTLPSKEDFIDRKVSEPLAVRLAGEYDVFDQRDPNAALFQFGLKSRDLSAFDWSQMLSIEKPSIDDLEKMAAIGLKDVMYPDGTVIPATVYGLLEGGKPLQYARGVEYSEVIRQQGFTVKWEGLTFLCCNSHELDIRSHLFEAGIKPEHDALLGFTFNGKSWRVSLYGVPGKPDVDLTPIAKKYKGGGHRQACGFHVQNIHEIFPNI